MNLIDRDLKHIWHPCSQMKDYETFPPLIIDRAEGAYLYTESGKPIIDAISSWWCKSLGHNHPRLSAALVSQLERFEHIILANTTNPVIVELSERLAQLSPTLDKVIYASDGSCVIEAAMKMSIHSRRITGKTERNKIMALSNGYHGETCLALSVSDLGIYKDDYTALLKDVEFIQNIPYVTGTDDPLWADCTEHWHKIEAQLNNQVDSLSAIIFEPILQGAGGMRIYSQDFLRRLRQWATAHDVHLIADEIMTGFGRTGYATACEHAGIEADFLCVAKGLTGGMLPMSAMLTSTAMYNVFYDDYAKRKSFLHSHTHSGNNLAAAVAIATLDVLQEENLYQHVRENSYQLREHMQAVQEQTGALQNIRHLGWVVAADLISDNPRAGYAVYQRATEYGALLRPLGNTLYWLPPLNMKMETLIALRDITARAINEVTNSAHS